MHGSGYGVFSASAYTALTVWFRFVQDWYGEPEGTKTAASMEERHIQKENEMKKIAMIMGFALAAQFAVADIDYDFSACTTVGATIDG